MNKDRVKTFILISLVLSSLFLSGKIWFSPKLWSNDYNFFVNWRKQEWLREVLNKLPLFLTDESNVSALKDYLYSPNKVVINLGEYSTVFYENSEEFEKFDNLYKDLFEILLKGTQDLRKTNADSFEWFDVLGSKDAYFFVDYGISCDTKTVGQIMGIKDTPIASSIPRFKELIIVPGDSVSTDVVIYLRSIKDDVTNKYVFKYDKSQLLSFIDGFDRTKVTKYIFSFEKDLDKKKNNKIIIDSEVIIPINKINTSAIKGTSSFKLENNQYIEKILDAFSYRANTLRRYIEQDNTIVYVENNSTLKLHPKGIIEYKAIEQGKGIKLYNKQAYNEKNAFSLYETLTMVTDFINKTGALNRNLHITSDLSATTEKQGKYKFTFNYFVNGIPVNVKLNEQSFEHALEVEVTNGTLSYYKEHVRSYVEKQPVLVDINVLQAVDLFLSDHKVNIGNDIKINNVFLNYIDDDSKELKNPYWSISVEGDERIHSVPAVMAE